MGQKVSPVGMRVGINKNWNSRWYADDKEFHVFLNQDIKIRSYLDKNLKDALLSHVEIERTKTDKGYKVVVMIFVARPGVVIGQDGKNINKIKEDLSKLIGGEEVRLDVVEVKQPDLDARIVAYSIAKQIEERASFRTAQKKAIQRVRKAGAKGCRTLISGRLAGADIARSEGYKEGIIPLHTLRSDIDYAVAEAATTYGRLGIKVWICRGEIRPELQKKSSEEKGE
ncbi:MAG: 30S ribosomal protein S3 [Erysipelotrichaceae bacterium]|jgi:small subunit ribosomal protein S3|nr:30S ribosomal protein S3 [Bacilli bacterium]NLV28686.1 30S ribosomal protein S3 [Erysipelotrichaceae bacterium]HPY79668.1 30S ribosomal protein S3 [Bacilli bacterium]HQA55692.1 30S ribosomal protein S3 [Bacilli bacterium]